MRAALADITETVRDGRLAMSVGVGFRVLVEMMKEELTAMVGAKHTKARGRRDDSAPGRRSGLGNG